MMHTCGRGEAAIHPSLPAQTGPARTMAGPESFEPLAAGSPCPHRRPKPPMKLHVPIALLTLTLLTAGARAQSPSNVTEGELALLPLFCRDTLGMPKTNFTPGFNHWVARSGEGFKAMHHYCWARINLRRLYAPGSDRTYRVGRLGSVAGDLFYVISNSPPDFVMLPEIHSTLAEVELLRKDPGAAYGHIQSAKRLNPGYIQPYRIWGEFLASTGKKADALEWFKAGLEYHPNDRNLRERYQALGGNPARIVPKRQAPVDAAAPASEEPASAAPASPAASAASAVLPEPISR